MPKSSIHFRFRCLGFQASLYFAFQDSGLRKRVKLRFPGAGFVRVLGLGVLGSSSFLGFIFRIL